MFGLSRGLSILTYSRGDNCRCRQNLIEGIIVIVITDQEENLVAGKKNPLSQLWHPRDRATYDILFFMMESGMPKLSFPLILIKRLLVYVWIFNGIIIRYNRRLSEAVKKV